MKENENKNLINNNTTIDVKNQEKIYQNIINESKHEVRDLIYNESNEKKIYEYEKNNNDFKIYSDCLNHPLISERVENNENQENLLEAENISYLSEMIDKEIAEKKHILFKNNISEQEIEISKSDNIIEKNKDLIQSPNSEVYEIPLPDCYNSPINIFKNNNDIIEIANEFIENYQNKYLREKLDPKNNYNKETNMNCIMSPDTYTSYNNIQCSCSSCLQSPYAYNLNLNLNKNIQNNFMIKNNNLINPINCIQKSADLSNLDKDDDNQKYLNFVKKDSPNKMILNKNFNIQTVENVDNIDNNETLDKYILKYKNILELSKKEDKIESNKIKKSKNSNQNSNQDKFIKLENKNDSTLNRKMKNKNRAQYNKLTKNLMSKKNFKNEGKIFINNILKDENINLMTDRLKNRNKTENHNQIIYDDSINLKERKDLLMENQSNKLTKKKKKIYIFKDRLKLKCFNEKKSLDSGSILFSSESDEFKNPLKKYNSKIVKKSKNKKKIEIDNINKKNINIEKPNIKIKSFRNKKYSERNISALPNKDNESNQNKILYDYDETTTNNFFDYNNISSNHLKQTTNEPKSEIQFKKKLIPNFQVNENNQIHENQEFEYHEGKIELNKSIILDDNLNNNNSLFINTEINEREKNFNFYSSSNPDKDISDFQNMISKITLDFNPNILKKRFNSSFNEFISLTNDNSIFVYKQEAVDEIIIDENLTNNFKFENLLDLKKYKKILRKLKLEEILDGKILHLDKLYEKDLININSELELFIDRINEICGKRNLNQNLNFDFKNVDFNDPNFLKYYDFSIEKKILTKIFKKTNDIIAIILFLIYCNIFNIYALNFLTVIRYEDKIKIANFLYSTSPLESKVFVNKYSGNIDIEKLIKEIYEIKFSQNDYELENDSLNFIGNKNNIKFKDVEYDLELEEIKEQFEPDSQLYRSFLNEIENPKISFTEEKYFELKKNQSYKLSNDTNLQDGKIIKLNKNQLKNIKEDLNNDTVNNLKGINIFRKPYDVIPIKQKSNFYFI